MNNLSPRAWRPLKPAGLRWLFLLCGLLVLVPQTSLKDGIVAHAWHVLDEMKPECSAWRARQQLLYRAQLPYIEAGEFALAP